MKEERERWPRRTGESARKNLRRRFSFRETTLRPEERGASICGYSSSAGTDNHRHDGRATSNTPANRRVRRTLQ